MKTRMKMGMTAGHLVFDTMANTTLAALQRAARRRNQ